MTNIATRTNVLVIDGQALTTTIDIASMFGKRHKDILRKVDLLKADLDPAYYERNFAPVTFEYKNGKGGTQVAPAYQVTRDGFVLLAMGFTGKQALQFKVAYIEEFNRMEATLRGEYVKLSPAQRRELQNAVSAKAYEIGGSREDFATVYRMLKDHFKVPTYADIPAGAFGQALELIDAYATTPKILTTDTDKMRYLVQQASALAKRVYDLYGVVDVDTFTLARDLSFRVAFAPAQYRQLAIA